MESPEKDAEKDAGTESADGSQIDDETPLEPGEGGSGIPFADQPKNPEENPPPSVAALQESETKPSDLVGATSGHRVALEAQHPSSVAADTAVVDPSAPMTPPPPWVGETHSGRREGGRKAARKPGRKANKNAPVATADTAQPQRMDVTAAYFVEPTQIFNKAATFLRQAPVHSSKLHDLVMWVENGLLWIRVLDTHENVFQHQCVPLSNVGSFTPA